MTVYEARAEPGGLARYAIAPYRQLSDPLPAEARLVADLGAEIRFGAAVESAAALREIEAGVDAVFLAVGMGPDADVRYPGDELRDVWTSLPFIEAVKTGRAVDVGAQVAVIGGGNTAIDAARIARRLGAERVTMVYRRSEALDASRRGSSPTEPGLGLARKRIFDASSRPPRLLDLVRVGGIVGLAAPVDHRHALGAEPDRLDRDVDCGVAAADHGDACGRRPAARPVLRASMNGSDSQTPSSSSPG